MEEENKDFEEENQKLIQQLMQDEAEQNQIAIDRMIQEEANQIFSEKDKNLPLTNYEKSKLKTAENRAKYGMNPDNWPEGVRPADQS